MEEEADRISLRIIGQFLLPRRPCALQVGSDLKQGQLGTESDGGSERP